MVYDINAEKILGIKKISPKVKTRKRKTTRRKRSTRKRKPVHHTKRLDFPKGKGNNIHIIIYVPSTNAQQKYIGDSAFNSRIKQTADFLSSTFGGATRVSGVGYWYGGKKIGLVKEKVAKVECFTKKVDYMNYDLKIKKWIQTKRRNWGQDSISYEFEEALYFVEKRKKKKG